ncbi:hypothetical protein [Pelagovum pacificum]|uniref:Glycosyltransferase RgtA/B/C/D-like domain-containing protein n=1 Tax=Pelagovum pacificum TaxID=2588711 RepID=A0A5C5GHN6_9RHOB|nr:hypothetical protein [Pelagovum pacificum]QQA43113.1 hypothetical protein I8N54_00615 [Pelagovum pacificum]TNY33744.1 hypothetical protein FHY64_10900 [Pelagovum pacificum]
MNAPGLASNGRARSQAALVLLCGLGLVWLYFALIRATGGHFVYALDDPYIHLALAENLLQGHYGINSGEVASPSSSILYPILLAGTLALGLGEYGPLVLNIVASLGVAWLLGGVLHDLLEGRIGIVLVSGLMLLLVVNGFGLAYTGMEHTLHVLASLLIVTGLARVAIEDVADWTLIAAIVAAPLLRFEGLALAGTAIVTLWVTGHRKAALIPAALLVICFGLFVTTMLRLGLPVLPSSVMVKSAASAAVASEGGNFVQAIAANIRQSAIRPQALGLGLGIALLLFASSRGRAEQIVAMPVAIAALAHMIVGDFGWFSRYEVYIVAAVTIALLIVWRGPFRALSGQVKVLALICALYFTGAPYLDTTLRTPAAAMNVEVQQYQLHRFVTEFYPGPVAVNDLGWTSWDNDDYVLDLWGLGSEEARKLAASGQRTPEGMADLVAGSGATYAMIYEEWFPGQIPAEWCRIAQLTTPRETAASGTVEFFLIEPESEEALRDALARFAEAQPPVNSVETFACGT